MAPIRPLWSLDESHIVFIDGGEGSSVSAPPSIADRPSSSASRYHGIAPRVTCGHGAAAWTSSADRRSAARARDDAARLAQARGRISALEARPLRSCRGIRIRMGGRRATRAVRQRSADHLVGVLADARSGHRRRLQPVVSERCSSSGLDGTLGGDEAPRAAEHPAVSGRDDQLVRDLVGD